MSHILIDILKLKNGRTVEEAIQYFDELKPVLEKHGISRVDQPLKIANIMRGELSGELVNLFATDDPQKSMQGMSSDPDYQAKVPLRDQIFDLENSVVAMTTRS